MLTVGLAVQSKKSNENVEKFCLIVFLLQFNGKGVREGNSLGISFIERFCYFAQNSRAWVLLHVVPYILVIVNTNSNRSFDQIQIMFPSMKIYKKKKYFRIKWGKKNRPTDQAVNFKIVFIYFYMCIYLYIQLKY